MKEMEKGKKMRLIILPAERQELSTGGLVRIRFPGERRRDAEKIRREWKYDKYKRN